MNGQALRILIIEDDPGVTEVMHAILKQLLGRFPLSQVASARHLSEGIALVTADRPHLVILDLTLLDSEFEETLARIGEIEAISPVVILTGHPVEEVRRLLGGRRVEIIPKMGFHLHPSKLISVFLTAIQLWRGVNTRQDDARFAEMGYNIERMKALNGSTETTE